MATYIPNATQTTEPVESRTVESAALEFRTLKSSINSRIEDVQDGLDTEIVNRIAGDANLQTQNNAQDVRLQAIEAALLIIGEGGLPGTVYVQRLSGTGAQTSFTLDVSVPSSALIDVFINGIYQNKNTFTIVDDVLTFSEAPPVGTDNVEVVVSITIANVETDASLVSFRATDSTAVVRTAQDKMREWVSVKDFGAVGDGVTDDTAAIQAAIDAVYAGSLQGGSLYFPKGSYRVTSSIYQKPRVNFIGDGSRKSQILWGAAGLANYEKGVVYCVAGTDASPDFVFSTCIEGMTISGGGSAPVALAIRGHQENCRFIELVLSGFTDAGLEALPFSSINHGITFSDLHIIPSAGASAAYGMRLSHIQKCVFDNITTDISNPNYYECGIYLYNTPLLNVFRAVHTEDCKYGIYLAGGANNVFIGLEARNSAGNGVAHFYTTSTRHTIHAMRTILGFTNHYQDAARTVTAGTDTDSVAIERGSSYFRRLSDSETYDGDVTLGAPRLTRGVDSYAGVSGAGQTYLRGNTSIPASSTRYVEINLGAGTCGFSGKLRLFSTGDQRYATEVLFAGYADGAGGVSGGAVSAQVGTNTTALSITAPAALASPEVGKIRIPIQNTSVSFPQILEVLVEMSVSGRQATAIAITS